MMYQKGEDKRKIFIKQKFIRFFFHSFHHTVYQYVMGGRKHFSFHPPSTIVSSASYIRLNPAKAILTSVKKPLSELCNAVALLCKCICRVLTTYL